jgi:hypothetical protein
LKLERTARNLYYPLKAEIATLSATRRIHDATIVEFYLALEFFVTER